MRDLIAPPLTPSGNYEPVALFDFLSQCQKGNIPPWKVAETLQISIDRANYALGGGFETFRRRALIAEGLHA